MSIEPDSARAAPSARPTTRAPITTPMTVPAAPKPSTNGATMVARPIASSSAPWKGREMSRKTVIRWSTVCWLIGQSTVTWGTDLPRGYGFARMAKVRLDTLLAERGLFASRSRAAASVLAGEVRLGGGAARAQKPGQLVEPDVELAVDE